MANDGFTLQNLFFDQPEQASALPAGSDSAMIEVKSDFAKQIPQVGWSDVSEGIEEKVGELMSTPIDGVLANAWKKYGELRKYADPEQYPPEETILVPLAKHTIKSSHKPSIRIVLMEAERARLQFAIELSLNLEGVVLKIQGGRILEIRAGSCQGSGSLECAVVSKHGSKQLFEKKAGGRKFDVARGIGLGAGVQIPAPAAAS